MTNHQPILMLPEGKKDVESSLQGGRTLSERQSLAIKNLSENGRSKGDALRAAGYSEAVARHPDRVFSSPYVRDALEKAGLSEVAAMEAVKRQLQSESGNVQLAAADMVFKIYGTYAPKSVVGKFSHAHGIMSMADLRRKMAEAGMPVVLRK